MSWPELSRQDGTSASRLRVEAVDHGDLAVIALVGDLDIYTVSTLHRELEPMERPGAPQLVIDLSRVGFLDSSGLGALVSVRNRLERDGARLGLICPGRLEAVLRAGGLGSAFVIARDLPGLRAALAGRPPALTRPAAAPARALDRLTENQDPLVPSGQPENWLG